MDIHDMPPAEAKRLAHHRYHESLKALHETIKAGNSPSVHLMETLERNRQLEEMAEEHMLRSLGLAPEDPDQIALPLDGAA